MTNVFNFENIQLAIEIGGSFGMLALTVGALIYTLNSKQRVQSVTLMLIFITLILAFTFQSALSIYDLKNRGLDPDLQQKTISNILYALQFIFQWLSLLIFTLEYLSTEQEVRKVLDMKSTKSKREWFAFLGVGFLLLAVTFTYLICRWSGESFFDSWASSLGEAGVAGFLLILQISFIQQISVLIREANLDLVPVTRTFCANLSVVGFIFLVQCGDVFLHLVTNLFLKKTKKQQEESNSTLFLILALSIQVCLLIAYFSFFLLIFKSAKAGRTFDDLILHESVPELVYLQTRKLLRDTHLERAEKHRNAYWENESILETKVRSKKSLDLDEQPVSFNPNLQSMRSDAPKIKLVEPENLDQTDKFIEERKTSLIQQINTLDSNGNSPKEPAVMENRLSHSHGIEMKNRQNESKVKSQILTESAKAIELAQSIPNDQKHVSSNNNFLLTSEPHKRNTNSDAQSFYTAAQDSTPVTLKRTESEFMSALESDAPYQQIPGEPPKSSSLKSSSLRSKSYTGSKRSSSQHNSNKLVTIKESITEQMVDERLIQDGNSCGEDDYIDKMSTDSEHVRDQARKIVQTYNMRLNKVGANPFQIRLNIFFSFVKATSVEAEAYDYLQSVEGSVMNHSDDSSVIERIHERTSSRLSVVSNYLSNLSD